MAFLKFEFNSICLCLNSNSKVAHAHGGLLSVETYTAAERPATPLEVTQLLNCCDIFSPNELEAQSMVGKGVSTNDEAYSGLSFPMVSPACNTLTGMCFTCIRIP